jgi:hypothetical protein
VSYDCCLKNLFVGLIVLLASGNAASGGSLTGLALLPVPSNVLFTTLAWEPSPSSEVTGYAVYYQVAGLGINCRVDAGDALTVTIPLQVRSRYEIYVVAYTAEGIESEPSNLLKHSPPPISRLRLNKMDDGGLQIRFRTSPLALCRVEWTDDLAAPSWQVWVTVRAGLNGDIVLTDPSAGTAQARFYLAVKL